MKQEVDPNETSRARAFEMWMKSPVPMVTLVKTFDVTHLCKASRRRGMKFNMLLCWCIGKAASGMEVFYMLPKDGRLYKYDRLAINVIVNNRNGGINSCDIPFTADLKQFSHDYQALTTRTADECHSIALEDHMVIGTSAMIQTELDCIVNQYTAQFCNPMVMWGRYRKGLFATRLPVSFQFHHVQMDGGHAARFLDNLQKELLNPQIS